jgi:hypothetical protein
MGVQQRADPRFVAEQQKARIAKLRLRQRRARDDHRRAMVAPHSVERDADMWRHGSTCTPAVVRREFRKREQPGEDRQ